MFQFMSLGCKIDNIINNKAGLYVFKINGQNHYKIGSLLPIVVFLIVGNIPKFAQLLHMKLKMKFQIVTYTIEFQKLGLPHVHILLWLHHDHKCLSSEDIDRIISAELPANHVDLIRYKVVAEFMLYGPSGLS
ncbi:Uncharacterized protein TCM_024266 [Theobroma cacao]|uniref:Helitron helicase-like domain-containing protein n=1 Tax=Theobroma cacao TaxID=3641 RepID=A0A061EV39_THECC|nr:Uncharacterized protein TCM_024266 [Theobroma cacao]